MENTLRIAQERYAQVGIALDWTINEVDPPAGLNLMDGLDTTGNLTSEISSLFDGLATSSVDDMQVFVVGNFYRPGFLHYGRAYPEFVAAGQKHVNSVLINAALLTGNGGDIPWHMKLHMLAYDSNGGHYGWRNWEPIRRAKEKLACSRERTKLCSTLAEESV